MTRMAYILSISIFLTQLSVVPSSASSGTGIWTQLCASGQWVKIELGTEKENPPTRPQHGKICHALCCSNKDEGDNDEESDSH